MQPGELVVRRIRWDMNAQQIGIVICNDNVLERSLSFVMWSTPKDRIKLSWHLDDTLLILDDQTIINEVKKRCTIA